MERLKKLSEVISLLLSRGYKIDFGQLTTTRKDSFQTNVENVPPEDFRVDEIFCCREKPESDEAIYVFAISSERYRFKGILINGYNTESLDFWNAFTETLEKLKTSLSELLSTHELSNVQR
jgi:hypothetical protein